MIKDEMMADFSKQLTFLEICFGTNDWQFRYIRGRCSYECRVKQGRRICTSWANKLVQQNV